MGVRGPHRTYGGQVDYAHIPEQYLKETTVEGYIQTRFDQAQLLHKGFAQPLNVVIIKALLIPAASSAPPVSVMLTTIASMAKTVGVALTLLDVE